MPSEEFDVGTDVDMEETSILEESSTFSNKKYYTSTGARIRRITCMNMNRSDSVGAPRQRTSTRSQSRTHASRHRDAKEIRETRQFATLWDHLSSTFQILLTVCVGKSIRSNLCSLFAVSVRECIQRERIHCIFSWILDPTVSETMENSSLIEHSLMRPVAFVQLLGMARDAGDPRRPHRKNSRHQELEHVL